MKQLFYILLVGLLPTLSFSQDVSLPQMDVMMRTASLRSALLDRDSISLSNLLADDVTYGHSTGLIQTKAQLIRDVMSGAQGYKTIDPAEMKVRVYDNAAIVNMNAKMTVASGGNVIDMNLAIVLVWIKQDKDWKLVARQAVKQ